MEAGRWFVHKSFIMPLTVMELIFSKDIVLHYVLKCLDNCARKVSIAVPWIWQESNFDFNFFIAAYKKKGLYACVGESRLDEN